MVFFFTIDRLFNLGCLSMSSSLDLYPGVPIILRSEGSSALSKEINSFHSLIEGISKVKSEKIVINN